jgi:hypothetical protein
MIANTPSLPFDLLKLLKASESLLKQNAAASPTAKHFDIGHRKAIYATLN